MVVAATRDEADEDYTLTSSGRYSNEARSASSRPSFSTPVHAATPLQISRQTPKSSTTPRTKPGASATTASKRAPVAPMELDATSLVGSVVRIRIVDGDSEYTIGHGYADSILGKAPNVTLKECHLHPEHVLVKGVVMSEQEAHRANLDWDFDPEGNQYVLCDLTGRKAFKNMRECFEYCNSNDDNACFVWPELLEIVPLGTSPGCGFSLDHYNYLTET